MPKYVKNFLTVAGIIVIGAFLVFLYDCIVGLADFAGRLNPGLEPVVFWALLAVAVASLGWWAAVALSRPRPLMVHADPTPEEMAGFKRQLLKRLQKNRILKHNGVVVDNEQTMEIGLTVLRDRADAEIEATAKRVFVGTAIAQNGRLDAIVVLFLISRLVWRISKIYNQRPHHRELLNLYANIAGTAFLAGSLDELGIDDYIHELLTPLIAGSAIGALPGAEAVAGAVTASTLSGATNSLLAIRCGILARNYMSLNLEERGSMRKHATLEAAKVFMSISGETVTKVTGLLLKGAGGAMKSGAKKMARGAGRTVTGAASGVGRGAASVGKGVYGSACSVGRGVSDSAKTVGQGVSSSARTVSKGVSDSARTVSKGFTDSARTVSKGMTDSARSVGKGVTHVGKTVSGSAKVVTGTAKKATDKVCDGAGVVFKGAGQLAGRTGQAASASGKAVEQSVRRMRDLCKDKVSVFRKKSK